MKIKLSTAILIGWVYSIIVGYALTILNNQYLQNESIEEYSKDLIFQLFAFSFIALPVYAILLFVGLSIRYMFEAKKCRSSQ